MDIIKAIITACGGALVTGIFAVISSRTKSKKATKSELSALNDKVDIVIKNINDLSTRFNNHTRDYERYMAEEARANILKFADDIRHSIEHSEEYWNETLGYIDVYEDYCIRYPDYPNTKAVTNIKYLKDQYKTRVENNDFLI